jgi:RNA polymerase sigma factor (sigma-70 family)
MEYSERIRVFEKVRARYSVFLLSVLWKLTGNREIFTEAMQYALLEIWRHIEKLNGKKAPRYIYRIALTANSRAWRNRIGKDGELAKSRTNIDTDHGLLIVGQIHDKENKSEWVAKVRQAIARLPFKQGRAIVMRYLEQQDYKTVAEKLCCTEAGARSHVSKAIATLKSKLAAFIQRE